MEEASQKKINTLQSIFSFKNFCKTKLKGIFYSLRASSNIVSSYLLILDQKNVRLISSYFKMIDLMEMGVTALEKLELKRKPFPKMQAMYLLTPTEASIDLLIQDYHKKKTPQYGTVHLFFSSKLPEHLFQKLALCQELMSCLVTFKEFNQEFFCKEDNIFEIDAPDALPMLYSLPEKQEAKIIELSTYLSTILQSFEKFSCVEVVYSKSGETGICEKMGKLLMENLKSQIAKLESNESEILDPASGKLTILLADRAQDPVSPLMHDFFYQPMLYDLLDIKDNVAEYEDEDKSGKKIMKKSILTENDALFNKYKYKHIAEALDGIPIEFQNFVTNNSTAKLQKGALNELDLNKMSDIIKTMPQYNELLKNYTIHMKLIEKSWKIFEERDMKEVGELEQSLATGIDREGLAIRPPKLLSMVGARLGSSKLTSDEKLRLVLLACLTLDIGKKDKEALVELLDAENRAVVGKLIYLGSQKNEGKRRGKGKKVNEEIKKLAKHKLSTATLDLCRHTPYLENLVEGVLDIMKKGKNFKELKAFELESRIVWEHSSKSPSQGKSLLKNKLGHNRDEESEINEAHKLVVFMVGGIGLNEVRSLMDLANNAENTVLVVGSTNIMKPSDYLNGLKMMK